MRDTESAFLSYADDVWRTVMRILKDEEAARECYQQTFLDVMRLDASSVENCRAFICKIATRRAIDVLRRQYRRGAHVSLEVEGEPAAMELSPDEAILHTELRERVRVVLTKLPKLQAEAFWLRHIESLKNHEIAEQLNIKPSHVRVLIHRAAAGLRKELGPSYDRSLSTNEET